MAASIGTVVGINPAKGLFVIASDDGKHSAWTLYSHALLTVGMRVEGRLHETGSEWLIPSIGRQQFEAFGEIGPTSLEECRRLLWG